MADISDYVKRLEALKLQSMDEYNKALENYKTNYPDFYNQLMAVMNPPKKETTPFMSFVTEYKWYLVAIGIGICVIIYLLFMLFTR